MERRRYKRTDEGYGSNKNDIRVFIRVRPLSTNPDDKCSSCVKVNKQGGSVTVLEGIKQHEYVFDECFDAESSQADVFESTALPLVDQFMSGHNCCVISYGEQGAGKTHSLVGSLPSSDGDDQQDIATDHNDDVSSLGSCGASEAIFRPGQPPLPQTTIPPPSQVNINKQISHNKPLHPATISSHPDTNGRSNQLRRQNVGSTINPVQSSAGIIPRVVHKIFSSIPSEQLGYKPVREFDQVCFIHCSFVMIYLEKVVDLLADVGNISKQERKKLKFMRVKENFKKGGVYIDGVTERHCPSDAHVYNLLNQGFQNRKHIETKFKADVSLSHSIFTIKLEKYRPSVNSKVMAKMHFCEWANSEFHESQITKNSSSSMKAKMKKANLTIQKVIEALNSNRTQNQPSVKPPYMNSKMTYLLKDSLGGNCVTSLLLNIFPNKLKQTSATIKLGSQIRTVKNNATINSFIEPVPERYSQYFDLGNTISKRIPTITETSNEHISHSSNEEKNKKHETLLSNSSTDNDERPSGVTPESNPLTQHIKKGQNLDFSKSDSTPSANTTNQNFGISPVSNMIAKPAVGSQVNEMYIKSKEKELQNCNTPNQKSSISPTRSMGLKSNMMDHNSSSTKLSNSLQSLNAGVEKSITSGPDTSIPEESGLHELALAENMLRFGSSSKTMTSSSLESVRGAAMRMEEDLASARNELTTVYALLKSSAKRMEEELSHAKELVSLKTEQSHQNQNQNVLEIENDLNVARKELENLSFLKNDSSGDNFGTNIYEFKGNSNLGHNFIQKTCLDTDQTDHNTKQKPNSEEKEIPSNIDKELLRLKLENQELRRTGEKQKSDLEEAQKDIKTLTLRAAETERTLTHIFNQNGLQNDSEQLFPATQDAWLHLRSENLGVSDIVKYPVCMKDDMSKINGVGLDVPNFKVREVKSHIRVFLRLRPMSKLETSRRSRSCIELHEGDKDFLVDSPLDGEYDFSFDKTFDSQVSQSAIYSHFGKNVVNDLLSGINHSIIACGLSSSGKTYTLVGSLPEVDEIRTDKSTAQIHNSIENIEDSTTGLTPRLVSDLFKTMLNNYSSIEFSIQCSYIAIYHEKIFDLLEPQRKKCLTVRETDKGVDIDGVSKAHCYNASDVFSLIQRGKACQSVLSTRMNIDTNRTHSILTFHIERRNTLTGHSNFSKLQIADLAGFEIAAKNKGQSLHETKIVHKSFSAFGNVVKTLAENSDIAPYRESKLTCVLKEALGGNCKTSFFVTASPSSYHISETINVIRLGQRVKRLVNSPHVNFDVDKQKYKHWLLETEVKFGTLVASVKNALKKMSNEQSKGIIDENSILSPLDISCQDRKFFNAFLEDHKTIINHCKYALTTGISDEFKNCSFKWRVLSTEISKKIPSDDIINALSDRDKAEAQLYDIQTEAAVLRRLNESLVVDKKEKEEEIHILRKDLKLLTLKISELEHKLKMSEYREKKTVMFLKYLRKICWRLQKDVTRNRSIDISEITSCISGAPDLSGLVDLDNLLVETGLIEQKELDLNDDEEEYDVLIQLTESTDGLVPCDMYHQPSELDNSFDDEINEEFMSNNIQPAKWLKNTMTQLGSGHWNRKGEGTNSEEKDIIEVGKNIGMRSRKEKLLECDLRNMTNKCIELQMLLNEEKANVDALTNRSGSLTKKKLAQEAITLRKERDRMMHNAKAATWKLQELHVVNRVLAKKSAETVQHVTFLEEGFKKLQETFRSTVLDSLDSDTNLRERLAGLESVVESLTVPQTRLLDQDEPSRPVHRMNLPIRGLRIIKNEPNSNLNLDVPKFLRRCLSVNASLKQLDFMPSAHVQRKAKFVRKSKKTGDAIGGIMMKQAISKYKQKYDSQLSLPTFQGNQYVFSYLRRG